MTISTASRSTTASDVEYVVGVFGMLMIHQFGWIAYIGATAVVVGASLVFALTRR